MSRLSMREDAGTNGNAVPFCDLIEISNRRRRGRRLGISTRCQRDCSLGSLEDILLFKRQQWSVLYTVPCRIIPGGAVVWQHKLIKQKGSSIPKDGASASHLSGEYHHNSCRSPNFNTEVRLLLVVADNISARKSSHRFVVKLNDALPVETCVSITGHSRLRSWRVQINCSGC